MALKKLIPNRPLRLTFKLLITALVLFLMDFAIWYIADRYQFKYESVAFIGIFLFLFLASLRKADKTKIFVNETMFVRDVVAFSVGTGAVCFVLAMITAIPVAIFPNWFGLVVIFLLLSALGRMKAKGKTKPTQGA